MKIEIWEIIDEHPRKNVVTMKKLEEIEANDLIQGVRLARFKYPNSHLRIRGEGKALVEIDDREGSEPLDAEAEAEMIAAIEEANK